jgi:hypothetical protein
LDENIGVLVGPKMQDLKVDDPDKYFFKPKELLAEITQIYINLGEEKEFVRAVASDGRSYKKEVFEKLARVLKHRAVMVDTEIKQVLSFLSRVEEAKATIEMEDERDIPDEFLGECGQQDVSSVPEELTMRRCRPAHGDAYEKSGDPTHLTRDHRLWHDPSCAFIQAA